MSASNARNSTADEVPQRGGGSDVWRWVCAGLSASLVGLGLARFAYTPLIPALIDADWFAPADVVYLGAANLTGYLAGTLAARSRPGSGPSACSAPP